MSSQIFFIMRDFHYGECSLYTEQNTCKSIRKICSGQWSVHCASCSLLPLFTVERVYGIYIYIYIIQVQVYSSKNYISLKSTKHTYLKPENTEQHKTWINCSFLFFFTLTKWTWHLVIYTYTYKYVKKWFSSTPKYNKQRIAYLVNLWKLIEKSF
jgi:hypothetical protein